MHDCTLSIVKNSKELKLIIEHARCLLFAWQSLPHCSRPETSLFHALPIALPPLALGSASLWALLVGDWGSGKEWSTDPNSTVSSMQVTSGWLWLLNYSLEAVCQISPYSVLPRSSKVFFFCPVRPKDGALLSILLPIPWNMRAHEHHIPWT